MEQHAIPQNISSYKFQLIGEMTLGQFGKVAGGAIIALIFYSLPLPSAIKWFFILLFGSAGALFAFVPLEGRSLEVWLISFFKSVYSPTQFVWKKSPVALVFSSSVKKVLSSSPPKKTENISVKELALQQALRQREIPHSKEEFEKANQLLSLFQQIDRIDQTPLTPLSQETALKEAKFKKDLPFPVPPDEPDILVGMVIDQNQKIIEGAIIEIEDEEGDTVRAMRTNKLGQFRTVSPLRKGQYQISLEKEGYHFDIMKINVKGEIIPPIEIQARKNKDNKK